MAYAISLQRSAFFMPDISYQRLAHFLLRKRSQIGATMEDFTVVPDLFDQQGNSILLIEEDKVLSEEIKKELTQIGYEVNVASNGKVALDLMQRISKPSLILMDPELSIMNGWEFEKHLELDSYYSSIPIILIVSHVIKTAGLKYKDIFRKPFDIESLLSSVKHNFFRGVFSESEDFDFKYSLGKT